MYNKNEELDIRNEMSKVVADAFPSDLSRKRIDARIDNAFSSVPRKAFSRKMPRIAVIVAACIAVTSTAVLATGTITGKMMTSSTSSYTYTSYKDLSKAEKTLGRSVAVPESLGEDYKFAGITMLKVSDTDENGNAINKRPGMEITYKDASENELTLTIEKRSRTDSSAPTHYQATENTENTDLYFVQTENLYVADPSQLTDEEKARSSSDPYFNIAYGDPDQEKETYISSSVVFEKDNLLYTLDGINTDLSAKEMFKLAETVVQN